MSDKRADGGADIKTKHENIKDYSRPAELAHAPAKVSLDDIAADLARIEDKLNQLILRGGLR
jgi:hypothetical protein